MFYDFFIWHGRPGGKLSRIGAWNARRYLDQQIAVLRKAGGFRGQVLEIGPGEGAFARECRAAGLGYHAIERSPAFCQKLREEGFEVRLGSAPPLPFESASFDLVCAMTVLEHLPDFNAVLELLQECHRVLKPGGMLALQVPDALRAGIDFYNWDYTHSFLTTPLRVRQVLHDSGFSVRQIRYFTGSLTGFLRIPFDLLGFLIHTRLIYWLAGSVGFEKLLMRYRKTFEPSFLVAALTVTQALSEAGPMLL